MNKISKQEVLEWALAYAEKGWNVFPIHTVDGDGRCSCRQSDCKDPGKHPRTSNGVDSATSDPAIIKKWFSEEAPLSDIGIATGANSSITVVDIDVGKKDGMETWSALNAEHSEPETLTAITGSGGFHLFFIYNSALQSKTDALGPGIDIRNDGGYIVAPPSAHKSGLNYKWENWGAKIASFPAHLIPTNRAARNGKRTYTKRTTKFTLEQVIAMLKHVSADNRDIWRNVGIILGREFDQSDDAWEVYVDWAATWNGVEGKNHQQIMREAFYEISKSDSQKQLTLGTIVKLALENGWIPDTGKIPINSFLYYAPGNNFIYKPTSEFWNDKAVDSTSSIMNDNGKLISASVWLRKNAATTSMTSDPDVEGECIDGFDCREGKLIPSIGGRVYNAYRPTTLEIGDPNKSEPFLRHVRKVFNKSGDADQFLNYMAHRVQKPGEKPRFALLIAGEQGVGKDTAINMALGGIGQWNVSNVPPSVFDTQFNEYASKVLVVISETANTQEISKWAFNERTKVLIAGQPDFMQINPKYGHKYTVRLHCGVIITTNHMHGVYIPQDDRRYDVIESASKFEMGIEDDEIKDAYFNNLWGWYFTNDGEKHIYAYLLNRNITGFSASMGQRKTKAHREIRIVSMQSDEWMLDALDDMGAPELITTEGLWASVEKTSSGNVSNAEFRSRFRHALKRLGYERLMNPDMKDGRYKLNCTNKMSTVYFNCEKISIEDALGKVHELKSLSF